jgi:hypothetical protein
VVTVKKVALGSSHAGESKGTGTEMDRELESPVASTPGCVVIT